MCRRFQEDSGTTGLTRVMLQKALEYLFSRVFEPPTDQKVIRIARSIQSGQQVTQTLPKTLPGSEPGNETIGPFVYCKFMAVEKICS
jgi:hypothetical protein